MEKGRLNLAFRYFSRCGGIVETGRKFCKLFLPLDFHFYMVDLLDYPMPKPFPPGIEFYPFALKRLQEKRTRDLPSEFFRDEIAGATVCFLVEVEGELASIVWLYDRTHYRTLIDLGFEEELNASATVEKFKGWGLYQANVRHALWTLSQQGQKRVWASAASDNPAPMHVLQNVGFRHVGMVRRCAAFGPKFSAEDFLVENGLARLVHENRYRRRGEGEIHRQR